jgi:hypothetical protein
VRDRPGQRQPISHGADVGTAGQKFIWKAPVDYDLAAISMIAGTNDTFPNTRVTARLGRLSQMQGDTRSSPTKSGDQTFFLIWTP